MKQQIYDVKGIHIADIFYLYPMDRFNWSLCKLYTRGTYKGKLHPIGQYFNRSTIDLAVLTVADLLEKERQDVTELREYAERIKRDREEFLSHTTQHLTDSF